MFAQVEQMRLSGMVVPNYSGDGETSHTRDHCRYHSRLTRRTTTNPPNLSHLRRSPGSKVLGVLLPRNLGKLSTQLNDLFVSLRTFWGPGPLRFTVSSRRAKLAASAPVDIASTVGKIRTNGRG
ncbi:hypothetical protein ANO14919_124490 [Xylariales sp. No.14919]|nr:hypothetical protein ANO14919_124490 [Xylariales sp. No.14919]